MNLGLSAVCKRYTTSPQAKVILKNGVRSVNYRIGPGYYQAFCLAVVVFENAVRNFNFLWVLGIQYFVRVSLYHCTLVVYERAGVNKKFAVDC